MSATLVGHRRKMLNSHWLKHAKTVPKKQNLGQKINDSKPHIWSLSIPQSQQKLAKKITHFTIQFSWKNLTHFTNINSLNVVKNILPQHSQKSYWLYKFSSKHVPRSYQEKHLHCSISRRPRTAFSMHLESKCNKCTQMVRHFCS